MFLPHSIRWSYRFLAMSVLLWSLPCHIAAGQNIATVIEETSVSGNEILSSDEIKAVSGLQEGQTWLSGDRDEYVKRLLEAYASRGYLDTTVDAFQQSYSSDSTAVVLRLTVREGLLSRVASLKVIGNRLFPADRLQEHIQTRKGAPFASVVLEQDIDRIIDQYENNGYPYCRIHITRLQSAEGGIAVELTIQEGPLIEVAGFRIEGNTRTKDDVIIREMRMRSGTPFSQKRMDRGRDRLSQLGIFNAVDTPEIEINSAGNGATILIQVEEGNTSALDGVLGYMPGTGGGGGFLTGAANLGLKNVGGSGRRIDASWSRRDPLSTDIRLKYGEPWLLGTPIAVEFELGQTQQDSSFAATEVGMSLAVPVSHRLLGHLDLNWRRVIPDSLNAGRLGESRSVTSRLGLSVDSRDDVQNPRRGMYARIDASLGIRWNDSSASFIPERSRTRTNTLRIDLEQYVPVSARQIAAFGLHAIDIDSNESVLPSAQHFRFGGTRSLRGYRENQFQGSRVLWVNAEYRVLLSRQSRFFVFLDSGYFEEQRLVLTRDDLKSSAGVGLRLESSLGILGIDYGVGEDDTLMNGKVHFGLRNEF